ncbi:phosphatidate cytidylyltransferase [Plasticicumulans acidivorans]|uniref:Phosphatidate cytidylyltransferase n=1 Tax=Plasticicumulans acidivorans TaxID=886464 RepID=A0A317MXI6_9GAMM|nr:phosphatidate cytidylyltransferase [Plasticicumulans acidivorans]PWV63450.1 phosphatidate cytidylyltransferase [Plasticicumulans acidivorans]
MSGFGFYGHWLLGGVLLVLVIASLIGYRLTQRPLSERGRATVDNLNARIRAWWAMCAVFAAALACGDLGTVLLFALVSFLGLREFITLTPTRRGDHETLFWSFFVFLPLHYWLVGTRWYGLFAILIPVYAFLFLPLRSALAGDTEHFLERSAKIQWGLMICVYAVSHAPALLMLEIPGYSGQNATLLIWLVLVVQLSDVLQYVFGKLCGRRAIVPRLSPNKTVEGFVGGVLSAALIGTALWWATPFTPWQAFMLALLVTLLGFAGGLVMSAIKRDRGVKDFGAMIEGHGGMLDRIDSLCFAAPVFFHAVRYWWT